MLFKKAGIMLLAACLYVLAQQSTDYIIVDAPVGTQASDKVLWIKWAGVSRAVTYNAPDSGNIYFDRTPGGGNLANYRYKINKFYTDTSINTSDSICNNIYFPPTTKEYVARRGCAFKAIDQKNMGFGVFYCVVALPLDNDTLISNEFQIMIESPKAVDWTGPSGTISSVTPTFQWNANSGVPYYHIILSDDVIKVDSSSGNINLEGLSIIWQAITPLTQIIYGAPDPSNTITADPPPLSPGQKYTWVVMNNYGNHAAFSSTKIKLPPGEFTITGTTLQKPVCVYPFNVNLNSADNKKIWFKWKNCDSKANTYKLYIYVGSDFEGINAQLVVYQTEVVGSGRGGENEIDSVEIDASSILTSNKYVWRMISVNDEGAGTVGDTVGFKYDAPVGTMKIYTREQIVIGNSGLFDTVTSSVGLVQLKVDVLDGSLEAPLFFYTDNNGYISRERPVGAYRITALKNEFEALSKTVIVKNGETVTEYFYLERPDATVFGKVLDEAGKGINLAGIYGVSDRGDTITSQTDALGSFILNCYAADWRIGVNMNGYVPAIPQKITVKSAENYNFGTVTLEKKPYALSGTVKNSNGAALLGAKVGIYKDGVLISEVPSTPQNGNFSFTVSAGTYVLIAEKTGFTSYNKTVDVMSSKSLTLILEPGATLVTGYVYGKTWVSGKEVIAPITKASVVFVKDASTDTSSVISDATYGDYKISLSGDKIYSMVCGADGFIATHGPKSFTTLPKSTQILYDTLQGLGMMTGTVTMSSSGSTVAGVTINLIDVSNGKIAATGKSTVNGSFEIRKIPDGVFRYSAAKDGLVLDSIDGHDSIKLLNGKPEISSVRISVKPGDKTIKWITKECDNEDATIKMQSPLVKTLSAIDSVGMAGAGTYIVSVDIRHDSIIDLAYHTFSIHDTETVHFDTVQLIVYHNRPDTIIPVKGQITIGLQSIKMLDSVRIFYKDAVATSYRTLLSATSDSIYSFTFIPPRDGSTMLYYFNAYKGSDIYGYDKEVNDVFIAPDKSMITRFEMVPSTQDTFSFPSSYNTLFTLKAYVSSSFISAPDIEESGIKWTLENAQECSIDNTNGIQTTLTTGNKKTSGKVELKAVIDTTKIALAPGLSNTVSVKFIVTGAAVKSVAVIRTDAGNPNPISTSSTDKAEFSATGQDENGKYIDLYPVWSINPKSAGNITANGIFRPAKNFAGIVRIFANAGNIAGEYRTGENTPPGLNVHYLIVNKKTSDTVNNGNGCSVIFPPDVVGKSEIGLLEITNAALKNQFKRLGGSFRTVDTTAFEIKQLENVSLDLSTDSLRLQLQIPEKMRKEVVSGKQKTYIAQWNEDSLLWEKINGSKLTGDGTYLSVGLTHFSRYSIIYEPSEKLTIDISPNPFSPYIIPHYNPFNTEDRIRQYPGTCIRVQADVKEPRIEMKIKIFTQIGDRVWSMNLQADNLPYYIWWDGRTSERDVQPDANNHVIINTGNKMCRNGRYFVVLTAEVNGKEQQKMKQLILMK